MDAKAKVGYAAFHADGTLAIWSVRGTRKDCAKAAVGGMMGWKEYQDLITDSDRWNHCYRRGCRIKRVTVAEVEK